MTGTNLFEQQALTMRTLAPAPPHERPLAAAMRFIEGANVSQCGKVAAHLSARLFALEKMHGGMQAANLNEAGQFVADALLDIGAVADMRLAEGGKDAAACRCGRCDDCVAARSDQHYDRTRDGVRR